MGKFKDFDLVYSLEALARAAAVSGDLDAALMHYRAAAATAEKISRKEDREQLLADVAGGNWGAFKPPKN